MTRSLGYLRGKVAQDKYLAVSMSAIFHLILIFVFMGITLKGFGVKKVRLRTTIIPKRVSQDIDSQPKGLETKKDLTPEMSGPSSPPKIGVIRPPPVLTVDAKPSKRLPYFIKRISPAKLQTPSYNYDASHEGEENGNWFLEALQGIGGVCRKDIVFVIDVSGSMGKALPDVKKNLLDCLGYLSPSDRFNIIFFHSKSSYFRYGLVAATSRNIQAAGEFVDSLKSSGGTCILPPLEKALSLGANIIFLLSDGQSSEDPNMVRRQVAARSKRSRSKVIIETFGFRPGERGKLLLRRLAEENNGRFHRIGENPREIQSYF